MQMAEPEATGMGFWGTDTHMTLLLLCLAPDDESAVGKDEAGPNFWRVHSELMRSGVIWARLAPTAPSDQLCLTSADPDARVSERPADKEARAAQRGPQVWQEILKAALSQTPFPPPKARGSPGGPLTSKDEVFILDVTPYVGDRCIASLMTMPKRERARHRTPPSCGTSSWTWT